MPSNHSLPAPGPVAATALLVIALPLPTHVHEVAQHADCTALPLPFPQRCLSPLCLPLTCRRWHSARRRVQISKVVAESRPVEIWAGWVQTNRQHVSTAQRCIAQHSVVPLLCWGHAGPVTQHGPAALRYVSNAQHAAERAVVCLTSSANSTLEGPTSSSPVVTRFFCPPLTPLQCGRIQLKVSRVASG